MSGPDWNTPIALGLLLLLLSRPSLGQISGALVACERGQAPEEGGDEPRRARGSAQRLHPPKQPVEIGVFTARRDV